MNNQPLALEDHIIHEGNILMAVIRVQQLDGRTHSGEEDRSIEFGPASEEACEAKLDELTRRLDPCAGICYYIASF